MTEPGREGRSPDAGSGGHCLASGAYPPTPKWAGRDTDTTHVASLAWRDLGWAQKKPRAGLYCQQVQTCRGRLCFRCPFGQPAPTPAAVHTCPLLSPAQGSWLLTPNPLLHKCSQPLCMTQANALTFTVLSTAPEKSRPRDTASAVTLPWCRSRVCVHIMLSILQTWGHMRCEDTPRSGNPP